MEEEISNVDQMMVLNTIVAAMQMLQRLPQRLPHQRSRVVAKVRSCFLLWVSGSGGILGLDFRGSLTRMYPCAWFGTQ